ncbi:DUF3224 domain-containing protein [Thalassotalea crassostreae]|uniref:DUF3224 domain-containing protein n=1 Tax=Thalassotalea crassostreae TaxID=1763536 RepID=UPI0008396A43|nr:DUF3224 domain-containing protein [Thalassotalea crassostreae]
MTISGLFDVNLEPQTDEKAPAGRLLISKKYHGDMQGSGSGQMLSKRTEGGAAAYCAIEEFSGSVAGKHGAFTLIHTGFMDGAAMSLDIKILAGSGQGELANITGSMEIIQQDGEHQYVLNYALD